MKKSDLAAMLFAGIMTLAVSASLSIKTAKVEITLKKKGLVDPEFFKK